MLDSCTKFTDYVDIAAEYGQKAIAFSEHGNIFNWVAKKMYCDSKNVKYLHAVEVYLTAARGEKIRDNYHTVLIAKNRAGLLELNKLASRSFEDSHFYYKPRISFEEFLNISNNVIKISACLASPLNRLPVSDPAYNALLQKYDYLEIQPHINSGEQKLYNAHLYQMSRRYKKPLIAGTDTHSLNAYKAECRSILQAAKRIEYAGEDAFDLTYKSFEELTEMFKIQNAIPFNECQKAIENTNIMADSAEDFELDLSLKYPRLYGSKDKEIYDDAVKERFEQKITNGVIPKNQVPAFEEALKEETRVFEKVGMTGFMLFMGELAAWRRQNDIPAGFARGSVSGSRAAYVLGITDVNPETWNTVFSRFCNEDRAEIGDVDIDVAPNDREAVFDYITKRFGGDNTAFILALGTICEKGAIDEIVRALSVRWENEHFKSIKEVGTKIKELRAV